MNEKLLVELGLNPREIKIYRAVVKSGMATPLAIAKATGIKRTTAYAIARGLVEKGLLLEDSTKRPRTFTAATPKDVMEVVSDERKRFTVREKIFKQLAEELSKNEASKTYPVPQIRFVPEERISQFLKNESPKWDDSMLAYDAIMWGFQDHTYVENYPNAIATYWRQAPKEIQLKMLTNQSEAELRLGRKYLPRRQMKAWKKANFTSGIWVMGDYLVAVSTRHKPHYLVEIHDAPLANDLRELFKSIWSLV
jgi:predicted transcriptional regulator